jgi:hypothetical protein
MRRRRAEVVASGFQWLVGAALFMGATGISAVASADEASPYFEMSFATL